MCTAISDNHFGFGSRRNQEIIPQLIFCFLLFTFICLICVVLSAGRMNWTEVSLINKPPPPRG